ncbi:MAG: hypothetical protein HPY50_02330 [Firmicutes bacterium]|nr:hypothetical protein [Bacillota bacterium]
MTSIIAVTASILIISFLAARKLLYLVFSLNNPLSLDRLKAEFNSLTSEERIQIKSGLAGMVAMFFLAMGSKWIILAMGLGGATGMLIGKFIGKILIEGKLNAKRREINLFYKVVDLFKMSGLSTYYSLSLAKPAAPSLKKAVSSCLGLWPEGPEVAFESLRREIALPEADILATMLLAAEKAGTKNLDGIIRAEVQNLERLREARIRKKISDTPIYYVIYRMLPMMAVFGLILGTFLLKINHGAQGIGLKFF